MRRILASEREKEKERKGRRKERGRERRFLLTAQRLLSLEKEDLEN